MAFGFVDRIDHVWKVVQIVLLVVALAQPNFSKNLVKNAESVQNQPHSFYQFPIETRNSSNIYNILRRRLSGAHNDEDDAPLFEGEGIHYVFIWVGSPPQRVSVIVDTGSHHTAFPCVGCKCGKHMDPFFDPSKSSTSDIRKCGYQNQRCFFRQSYSEGSSWHAYKVADKVFVGGEKLGKISQINNLTVDFEFGCQDSETGLFRTQHVDGIMGLSASDETLPFQLYKKKVIDSRVFSLCFRSGGGTLSIGGLVKSHAGTGKIQYAKLLKSSGWFTIRLIDISLLNPRSNRAASIGGPIFKCNTGKGTIVDSGTTDTYLPQALHSNFVALFKSITGISYSNNPIVLSTEQFAKLPSIVYKVEGIEEGSFIEIAVKPISYMEKYKGGKFVPRVYLTEGIGAVLGANFMHDRNVIFDIDQMRIGFSESSCT